MGIIMAHMYISAGHGGKQPGAVYGSYIEKTYTVQIANALSALLRAAGHTVTQNRTTDADISIEGNCAQANKLKTDMFIDIHLNAGGGTGCETYYSRVGGTGKIVAVNIAAAIAELGYKNRGAKTKLGDGGKDYYAVIRETSMPAVLCECCFIDSAEDMKQLNVNSMAEKICAGILMTYPAVTPAPVADTAAENAAAATYRVQVGAFSVKANADKLAEELKSKGYAAFITE